VYVLEVEGLEPPIAGRRDVYRPAGYFEIEGSESRGFSFGLTVAASDPEGLRVRFVDSAVGSVTDCVRSAHGAEIDGEVCVYTVTGSDGFEARVSVSARESLLSARTRVDVYSAALGGGAVLEGGAVLGSDSISLSGDFYYMAVVGDSVAWGNGLTEGDKFASLAARRVEAALGQRVVTQTLAHSAANVLPVAMGEGVCEGVCTGEVPRVHTAIVNQVELIASPEEMDLVIVVGCINDIGITSILNPFFSVAEIEASTDRFCGEEMLGLLRRIRARAPAARIVVGSYYPMVGADTDPLGLLVWAEAQGVPTGEIAMLLSRASENAAAFDARSRSRLGEAVATVNDEAGMSVAVLACPAFGGENVAFGSETWLWGLEADEQLVALFDLGLGLIPQDPLRVQRARGCPGGLPFPSLVFCVYASVGHPNRLGAVAYAEAVVESLVELGVIAAGADSMSP
jgi:lysophospholipase L1-like esterase